MKMRRKKIEPATITTNERRNVFTNKLNKWWSTAQTVLDFSLANNFTIFMWRCKETTDKKDYSIHIACRAIIRWRTLFECCKLMVLIHWCIFFAFAVRPWCLWLLIFFSVAVVVFLYWLWINLSDVCVCASVCMFFFFQTVKLNSIGHNTLLICDCLPQIHPVSIYTILNRLWWKCLLQMNFDWLI